tara:strand:+ start:118 stop:804 length:687 start_codon:yes stop_codon:yes gene_type:complete
MKCENCSKVHDGSYASGRFCSKKCSKSFSTKSKRKEINAKVSTTLKNRDLGHERTIKKICRQCKESFEVEWHKRKQQYCSSECLHKSPEKLEKFLRGAAIAAKKRSEDINERIRLREIGRKGGFGKKGYTASGTRYESTIERDCFEYLEKHDINFEAHKSIPNSSKVSDVFIPSLDLWIEIDGINRERSKNFLGKDYERWLEKLKIYKSNKLNVEIVKSLNEFKQIFN